jgi:outer membrane protein TolC
MKPLIWQSLARVLFFAGVMWADDAAADAVLLATPTAIDRVGREMIDLLTELAAGESDPSKRLPPEPVLTRARIATDAVPLLRVAQSGELSAMAQRREALAALLPQVTLSAGGGQRAYDFGGAYYAGGGRQISVNGRQLLYDFGASRGALNAADKRIEASRLRIDRQRSEILLRALEFFYETQRALLQVRLARENLEARRSFVSYITERAELGASSNADVIRAEARVAEGLDILASAMQRLAVSQANYRQFYGVEAEPYVLPFEEPLTGLQAEEVILTLRNHPLLIEADLNLAAAKDERDAAQAKLLGGVFFEVTASHTDDPGRNAQRNDSAMVVLRSELYSGGAQSARVAQAEAKIQQMQAEFDRVQLELERSAREAFSDFTGQVAAVSARMLVFRSAQDSYLVSKELFAFSRSSLFDVFRTQEDLNNAGQRLIDSIVERAKAKFKLLHAMHRLQPYAEARSCNERSPCNTTSPSLN